MLLVVMRSIELALMFHGSRCLSCFTRRVCFELLRIKKRIVFSHCFWSFDMNFFWILNCLGIVFHFFWWNSGYNWRIQWIGSFYYGFDDFAENSARFFHAFTSPLLSSTLSFGCLVGSRPCSLECFACFEWNSWFALCCHSYFHWANLVKLNILTQLASLPSIWQILNKCWSRAPLLY